MSTAKKLLPVALIGGAIWYFFLRKPALPAPTQTVDTTGTPISPEASMSAEEQILRAQQIAEQARAAGLIA
jgi:hypothetical protein